MTYDLDFFKDYKSEFSINESLSYEMKKWFFLNYALEIIDKKQFIRQSHKFYEFKYGFSVKDLREYYERKNQVDQKKDEEADNDKDDFLSRKTSEIATLLTNFFQLKEKISAIEEYINESELKFCTSLHLFGLFLKLSEKISKHEYFFLNKDDYRIILLDQINYQLSIVKKHKIDHAYYVSLINNIYETQLNQSSFKHKILTGLSVQEDFIKKSENQALFVTRGFKIKSQFIDSERQFNGFIEELHSYLKDIKCWTISNKRTLINAFGNKPIQSPIVWTADNYELRAFISAFNSYLEVPYPEKSIYKRAAKIFMQGNGEEFSGNQISGAKSNNSEDYQNVLNQIKDWLNINLNSL